MIFRLVIRATAIALAAAGARPLPAQVVSGIVVSEAAQRPVAGARVALVDRAGKQVIAQTVADSAEGVFYLAAPGAGEYRVRIAVGRGGIVFSPPFTLNSGEVLERRFAVPPLPAAMLEAFPSDEVTRRAVVRGHQAPPRFPDRQRAVGGAGIVRALVVVDSRGRALMETFRVLETPHEDFTHAVTSAVRRWRFQPAEREGVPVAQVKPLAFDFGYGMQPPELDDEEDGVVIRSLGEVRQR